MSPTSVLYSLANRANIVCHTNGLTSIISDIYATMLPPTLPRQKPTGISFSQHQDIISDINNIKPVMPIFFKTRISSFILSTYSFLLDLSIIPLRSFSLSLSPNIFQQTSSSFSPYNSGYFKEVSRVNGSTLFAIRFVFSIASK